MKIGRKDVSIFKDGAILNNCLCTSLNFQYLVQAIVQKVNLKIKAPTWHILIKIVEVRIMIHIFKLGYPFVMLGKHFSKGRFSSADITGNCHMFWFFTFRHISDKFQCTPSKIEGRSK